MIILKRDEDDEDILTFYDHSDIIKDREVFKKFTFEEGSYVVVPFTSGSLLQKVTEKISKKEGNTIDLGHLDLKSLTQDYLEIRQYFCSTMYDVFRKIDIAMNGILSAKELNQFGHIINDNKFKKIKQSDFTSEEFKEFSKTKEGFTKFGFFQFIYKHYKPNEIVTMLKKLGYDEKLNSLKSRVFVISFQAEEPLRVTVHDILKGNMYKTAMNIFLEHKLNEEDVEIEETDNDEIKIFKFYDRNSKTYLFGAVNESDSRYALSLTTFL